MLLSGPAIQRSIDGGELSITPFNPSLLKGASYTFTLGPWLRKFRAGQMLEPGNQAAYDEITIPLEGYVLEPGEFVLGVTAEHLALGGKFVCLLSSRGSCAQIGLNVLLSSTLAEPDTDNPQLLEISNATQLPILLKAGLPIIKGIFLPVS